jgi:hypothetical protein
MSREAIIEAVIEALSDEEITQGEASDIMLEVTTAIVNSPGIWRLKGDRFDWESVFNYGVNPETIPGDTKTHQGRINPKDIVIIFHSYEGVNDQEDWIAIGKLLDGRFFCIRAGCDYTGWGRQERGSSQVASSYEDIITYGLSDDERATLGINLKKTDLSFLTPKDTGDEE